MLWLLLLQVPPVWRVSVLGWGSQLSWIDEIMFPFSLQSTHPPRTPWWPCWQRWALGIGYWTSGCSRNTITTCWMLSMSLFRWRTMTGTPHTTDKKFKLWRRRRKKGYREQEQWWWKCWSKVGRKDMNFCSPTFLPSVPLLISALTGPVGGKQTGNSVNLYKPPPAHGIAFSVGAFYAYQLERDKFLMSQMIG